MRSLHFFFLFFFALSSIGQDYPKKFILELKSEGTQLKASKISQGKNTSKIKSIASVKNDSLKIELLYMNRGEYWTYHILTRSKKAKWVSSYQLDHNFDGLYVDKMEIHPSPELFFTISIEKHNMWSSNYEKGKSLSKGVFLLKVVDEVLHYRYFKESVERSGVDYRTGSFNEKTIFQEIVVDNGYIQFAYPEQNTKKVYKMSGVELILQEN